jgi:hypothetical protein
MNDKPFTFYYIPQLKYINCDNFSTDCGKISDIRTVSKGINILGFNENSNYYMIVGDNSSIISMGMVKKIETKNKNIIYIGRRIYSNSQKELYDYIKQKVTEKIQTLQKEIVRIQDMKKNISSTLDDIYNACINEKYKTIKTIQTNSKNLIANLKKV